MANFTKNWTSSRVDGDSDTMNEVDDFINELYTAISERISDFIYGFATDNSETDDAAKGFFKLPLKEQASDPSNESGKGILYTKDVSGVTELFYEDSDGNVKQLTTGGKLNVASDEAVLLSGDQTVNGVKTFGSIPVLPASDPSNDNEAARKKYVDDEVSGLIADMPTGVTKSADTLNGNGSYDYGKYYYLVIGKDSNGQLKMVSGVANSGTQIPLPDGCAEEDCHWLVSIAYSGTVTYASTGVDCYIDSNRKCYVRTKDNNWVS